MEKAKRNVDYLQILLGFPCFLRQRALSKSREPIDQTEFVALVVGADGDGCAARLIHDHLQEWIVYNGFTPYPDDEFLRVYGIAEEELDEDLALMLFEHLEVAVPSNDFVQRFGAIETPTRLCQLIAEAKRADTQEE